MTNTPQNEWTESQGSCPITGRLVEALNNICDGNPIGMVHAEDCRLSKEALSHFTQHGKPKLDALVDLADKVGILLSEGCHCSCMGSPYQDCLFCKIEDTEISFKYKSLPQDLKDYIKAYKGGEGC